MGDSVHGNIVLDLDNTVNTYSL